MKSLLVAASIFASSFAFAQAPVNAPAAQTVKVSAPAKAKAHKHAKHVKKAKKAAKKNFKKHVKHAKKSVKSVKATK